MKLGKIHWTPKLVIGILITSFFAVSLIYRVVLPYHQIFTPEGIKYSTNDAYLYMRWVDNLVHNFPHLTAFDPYYLYPSGAHTGGTLFFVWFQALIIWIIGLGSPSQHMINAVSVFFPPIMAALTIIPVYFIGKALFNRWAGVLAAGLVAVFPGEFMGRTILGGNDTPVPQVFFTTIAMAFLFLAIRTASQRGLTLSHFLKRDWKVFARPLVYSLLAGFFLGLYLDTWFGALLFVFIVSIYLVLQFIINHLRGRSSEYLGIVGTAFFLVPLIVFLPFSPAKELSFAVVVALLIPLVLVGGSMLMSKQGLKRIYYPLSLVVLGGAVIGIVHAVFPDIFRSLWSEFNFVFFPSGSTVQTTNEMVHFLSNGGIFTTQIAWTTFTTSFFLVPGWPIPGFAFISFVILVYLYFRNSFTSRWAQEVPAISPKAARPAGDLNRVTTAGDNQRKADSLQNDNEVWLLFFVWTLVILVATLVGRRYAYYLVVNVALLSGYISWQIIWHSGLKKLMPEQKEIPKPPETIAPLSNTPQKGEVKSHVTSFQVKKAAATAAAKKHKKAAPKKVITVYHINTGLAIVVVLVLVFCFNLIKSSSAVSEVTYLYAPSDGWQASLLWMKDNTPEPLGDPNAYYESFKDPSSPGGFKYPDSAYAVTSWWDYGYWITRIARRIPNSNPSQDPAPIQKTAELFLSSNETRIQELLKEFGSDYIIADYSMSTSKFWAIVNWAGRSPSDFFENYYYAQGNQLVPVQVLTPAYYYCLLTRLYNFDGKAVTQVSPAVITFENKTDNAGHAYQEITDIQQFTSYQDAVDYVNKQGPSNHKIIGTSPFSSPVPLDAVPDFQLIYSSSSVVQVSDNGTTPEVKIFQYLNSK